MEVYEKSLAFEVVFGVNPGYDHSNSKTVCIEEAINFVASAWQFAMQIELESSDISASGVVTGGKVAYSTNHGCPEGGEDVAVVRGNMHPYFVKQALIPRTGNVFYTDLVNAYMESVIRVAENVKQALGQERVQVTFSELARLVYLTPDEGQ